MSVISNSAKHWQFADFGSPSDGLPGLGLRDELLAERECAWYKGENFGTSADGLSPKKLQPLQSAQH